MTTKKDLKAGVQFTSSLIDSATIYTIDKNLDYVSSDIFTASGYKIESNQYNIKKITNKYIYLTDFVICKEIIFKIPLQHIKIINQ